MCVQGISFTLIITHVGLCEMTDDARDADEHALYVHTDMVFSFNAGIGSRRASVRVDQLTAASGLSRDNAFDLDTLRCRPEGLDNDSGSRSKMPEYVGAA